MYNVLYEAWIPVKKKDGTQTKISLKEAILNGHEYLEVMGTPFVQFGIYKFLATFASDMIDICKETDDFQEACGDICECGYFPEDKFDTYIEKCKEDGCTFDLFDENRPFLQSKNMDYTDKDYVRSACYMEILASQGTNTIYFTHKKESDYEYEPDEILREMIAFYCFPFSRGRGNYASDYGEALPVFCLVKGEDLFEMITFNLFANEDVSDKKINAPLWRQEVPFLGKFGDTLSEAGISLSTFGNAFFPWRAILLMQDDDGKIRKLKMKSHYKGDPKSCGIIRDPFIPYIKNPGYAKDNTKREMIPLVIKEYENVWKNITGIVGGYSNVMVKGNYNSLDQLTENPMVDMLAYIITQGRHGVLESIECHGLIYPKSNDEKTEYLQKIEKFVNLAIVLQRNLGKAVESVFPDEKEEVVSKYSIVCQNELMNAVLPDYCNYNYDSWKKYVYREAFSLFDTYVVSRASKQKDLIKVMEAREKIFAKPSKKKK